MSSRPIIGIATQSLEAIPGKLPACWVMGQRYVRVLAAAGAVPWLIPLLHGDEATLRLTYERLDARLPDRRRGRRSGLLRRAAPRALRPRRPRPRLGRDPARPLGDGRPQADPRRLPRHPGHQRRLRRQPVPARRPTQYRSPIKHDCFPTAGRLHAATTWPTPSASSRLAAGPAAGRRRGAGQQHAPPGHQAAGRRPAGQRASRRTG